MPTELYILAVIFFSLCLFGLLYVQWDKKRAKHIKPLAEDPLLKMMNEQMVPIHRTATVTAYTDTELADFIRQRYKYWSQTLLQSHAGIATLFICWNPDDTVYFAELYYNGGEYSLEKENGVFYFTADDYAPEIVPPELREVLPQVQRQLEQFDAFEFPPDEYWSYQTLVELIRRNNDEWNIYATVNLLMFCWYFRSESGMKKGYIDHFENALQNSFKAWGQYEYEDNSLFLFAMGWIQRIEPMEWYADDDGETGIDYLLKAHQLEPTNPLYKWAVSDQLNLTREETRALAVQVDESQFNNLEPFIKDYFMEILQGDALSR